jgi:hypothetical protein
VKELLAGIIIALLPVTVTAAPQARPHVIIRTTLPPAEYDKPFNGELEIQRFATSEDIQRVCKGEGVGIACSARAVDGTKCWIFVVANNVIEKREYSLATILRHELGHCNGWKHGKKDGGRWIRADSIRTMPALPASTRWFPAYPPVVCLTPEWKPEPCKNRNESPYWVAKP